MSRWVKQLIYVAFYLGIVGLVVYGVISTGVFSAATCFDNRQNQGESEIDCDGPCVACAIKKLKPLRSEIQFFGIDGNTNAVLILSNPNITYGAESFTYTINFKNQAGENLLSLKRESFIYPAESQKMIIEPNLRLNFREIAGEPEIIIENLDWRPAAEFVFPKTQTRQVQNQLSGNQFNVTGLLANRESFPLPRVVVGAIIVNKTTRIPVGASKTVIQDVKPFEERAFKIIVPLNKALKLADLDVVLSVETQR